MEDRRIPDSAITASSSVNSSHGPSNSRLNFLNKGSDVSAWCPKTGSENQWLQIDLGEMTAVTKVATQGRYNSEDRVTTYTLSYSVDGKHWAGYKQHAIDRIVLTKFVNKLSLCFMRSPNRRGTSLFTNIVFVVLINFETNETKESFVKRTSTLLFGTLVSIGDISVSIAIASPRLDAWR